MISGGVDVIILAANQVPASVAARSLAQQGSTVPVITSYVNADASWLGLVSEVLGSFDVYASAWIDVASSPEDLETYVTEEMRLRLQAGLRLQPLWKDYAVSAMMRLLGKITSMRWKHLLLNYHLAWSLIMPTHAVSEPKRWLS